MEPKKYEHRRLERKIPIFFLMGLNIALLLSIVAFEWKSESGSLIVLDSEARQADWVEGIVLPPPPPPPMPEPPKAVNLIETTVDPIEPPTATIAVESPTTVSPTIYIPPIDSPPVDEAPFIIVEEMPSYPGGWSAFYSFVGKNTKYPKQAQRLGIEGKVFIEFTIEKDGSITDLIIKKGLEGGFNEEVLRIMDILPQKFNPGKQRGKPVRVRQSLAINFQLQN